MATELGQVIRAARERQRLTQEELAEAVGVNLRTVGNWERGETSPRGALARIVAVLGPLEPPTNGLRTYPDEELLAEVARRMKAGTEALRSSASVPPGFVRDAAGTDAANDTPSAVPSRAAPDLKDMARRMEEAERDKAGDVARESD